jgi:hypothetical protein
MVLQLELGSGDKLRGRLVGRLHAPDVFHFLLDERYAPRARLRRLGYSPPGIRMADAAAWFDIGRN